jgi:hypothetical protein
VVNPPVPEFSVRLIGEVWRVRYLNEEGLYPKTGNLCIAWLVKLLAVPNRALTVGKLRGDPEEKLAADATLGSEREADGDTLREIKKRLDDIEGVAGMTGWTESLEREKAALLAQLKTASKTLTPQLGKEHHNIATQFRNFIREKLAEQMPQLAAHLKVYLNLDFPEFAYRPPNPPPAWQI